MAYTCGLCHRVYIWSMEFGSFMVTSVLFLEFSRRGILGVGWFVINSIVAVMSYAIKPKKKKKKSFKKRELDISRCR